VLQSGHGISLEQRPSRYELARYGLGCLLRQAAQFTNDRAVQLIGADAGRKLRDDDARKRGTIGTPTARTPYWLVGPPIATGRTRGIRPLATHNAGPALLGRLCSAATGTALTTGT
jgi:hypothetical protein